MDVRALIRTNIRSGSVLRMESVFMIGMAIAAAVFTAVVQLSGVHSSVIEGYFPYADAMMHGVLPYTDKVFVYGYWNVWEYPPLAYVFLFIPRIIGSTPATYHVAYIVLVLGVIWAGMRSIGNIAEMLGHSRLRAVALYSGMLMLMIEFVFDRYDVLPVVICIVAVQFFLQKRYPLAASMAAIGTFVKLYPALLLIIFIVWLIRRNEVKKLAGAALGFFATCCLIVPFVVTGDITQMFAYHSDRPLEIESLFGAFSAFVAVIVPDSGMHVVFSYGSDNIVGGIADALSSVVTYVMLASVLSVYILHIWLIRKCSDDHNVDRISACAMLLVVAAFITFGSVFSAQYIVWLIPFIIILMMFLGRMESDCLLRLFVISCILTQLDFLVNFGMRSEGAEVSVLGIIILLVRNSLMIYIIYVVGRYAVDGAGQDCTNAQMS